MREFTLEYCSEVQICLLHGRSAVWECSNRETQFTMPTSYVDKRRAESFNRSFLSLSVNVRTGLQSSWSSCVCENQYTADPRCNRWYPRCSHLIPWQHCITVDLFFLLYWLDTMPVLLHWLDTIVCFTSYSEFPDTSYVYCLKHFQAFCPHIFLLWFFISFLLTQFLSCCLSTSFCCGIEVQPHAGFL